MNNFISNPRRHARRSPSRRRRHPWPGYALAASLLTQAMAAPSSELPAWQTFSWPIPTLRGLYMPADDGTLGAMAFGYTDDDRRILGGATFFYDTGGQPVVLGTDGVVHINDNATVEATGVIAWTEFTTLDMSGGACRGCDVHPPLLIPTANTNRFEWTSPRAGRLTVDGQTQTMVEAFSGEPLVASVDYAGSWLMIERQEYRPREGAAGEPPPTSHYEHVFSFDLVPTTQVDPMGNGSTLPVGARLYEVRCRDLNCDGWLFAHSYATTATATVWFDDTDLGGLLIGNAATTSDDAPRTSQSLERLYGTSGRIVGRAGGSDDWLLESLMVRMGDATLDGRFNRPSCLGLTLHGEAPQPGECND